MDNIPKMTIGAVLANKARLSSSSGPRPLYAIAREIQRDWNPPNFAAKPYLDAMATLTRIEDNYYLDSGLSIVSYFLANAGTWRGEVAQRVKAELKQMCKSYDRTKAIDPYAGTPKRG